MFMYKSIFRVKEDIPFFSYDFLSNIIFNAYSTPPVDMQMTLEIPKMPCKKEFPPLK